MSKSKIVDPQWARRVIGTASADKIAKLVERSNYQSVDVFWLLVRRCDEISFDKPRDGLMAAQVVCGFASGLGRDQAAMGLAVLGSAYRMAGNLAMSRVAYEDALKLAQNAPNLDPVIKGRILQRFSALAVTELRTKEALDLVNESLKLLDDGLEEAVSLVLRSKIFALEAEYEKSLEDACFALQWLDPIRNVRAYLSAVQSVADSLLSGGNSSATLIEVSRLIQKAKKKLGSRKVRESPGWFYLHWIDAQIAGKLGMHREAIRKLLKVREGLFEAGGDYFRDALLASVDLAVVYEDSGSDELGRKEVAKALELAKIYGFSKEAATLEAYLDKGWLFGIQKDIRS